MHFDVGVADEFTLVPFSVLEDVLDMAVGVDPFESEAVPVDGRCGCGGESVGHGGCVGLVRGVVVGWRGLV